MKKRLLKVFAVMIPIMLFFSFINMEHHSVKAATVYKTITIKKGVTLWELSRQYHTTVSRLKSINHLISDRIYAGAKLKVPAAQSNKTAKQYLAEVEKSRTLTKNEKMWIKKSRLIEYVLGMYKDKMKITGYEVQNSGLHSEDPPYVILKIREKSTGLTYMVTKEMIGKDDIVVDYYINNKVSYEARKLLEPSLKVFKKKPTEFFIRVQVDMKTMDQLTKKKLKWNYSSVRSHSNTHLYFLLPDTKESYGYTLTFLKELKASQSKVNISNINFYYYSGKKPTQGNVKVKAIRIPFSQLGNVTTMEKLKGSLEKDTLYEYIEMTRSLVKQKSLYK
ncbi:LysM peptidoglycan-binding domain-containing protein [Bacillus massilinigeriensis]|uniref:LysM peptidoglycan-binding domain-containing protein n=1 Tax=Bacillus massilionigeriensis TaxID=1805475 RepID=UPI00096B49C3|nr:LysM peptidoglycan-binding domain-containing protein [Bacillus massilionigeriensis]